jgi:hypothetical protein
VEADRIKGLAAEFAILEKEENAPEPVLTGDDLTAAGFLPGPVFKRILDAVYDAQLEGRIGGKADALEMAHTLSRSL